MLPRLQEMVLLKVYDLGPRCTIAAIQETLSRETQEEQGWPSIHTTVERLIEKGLVTYECESLKPNRLRQTKLYSITPLGHSELMESIRTMRTVYGRLLNTPLPGESQFLPVPELVGQALA